MATVNVGSLHSDSHSFTVFQTGQNYVDLQLRNDLFNSDSSEWLCAVESLQVPLDSTRYFSGGAHTALFNIRRLRHGVVYQPQTTHLFQESATDIVTDILPVDPVQLRSYTVDTVARVRTDRFECRAFGDFVEMLIQWYQRVNMLLRTTPVVPKADGTQAFNQQWDQRFATRNRVDAGGANVLDANGAPIMVADDLKRKFEHLRVRISASGNISFIFSRLFASMFFIEVTEYAQEIFGLPEIVSFDLTVPGSETLRDTVHNNVPVVVAGITYPGTMIGRANPYVLADDDWTVTLACSGTKSIFSSIDTRLSVALTTDLGLKRSLVIVDGTEEFSSILFESPLDNEFHITNIVSDQFHSEFHAAGRSRAGQYMVKGSSNAITEWVSLASDINVRTLRLRLSIRERVFISKGVWRIVLTPLPVESHTAWHAKLLFVKRIH